jgi:peptide/nickel transport system substrate-binding protein
MDSLKNKIIKISKKAKYKIFDFFVFLKNIFKSNLNNGNRVDLDKKLIYSLSKSKIPSAKQIKYIGRFLSPRESLIIKICLAIIFINVSFLGFNYIKNHLEVVPTVGGEYTEGVVGFPKYINPLYSSANDIDNDIGNLVYSSLFKRDKNNELIGDLAESYEIKNEGKNYLITLKNNIKWHNGDDLTVDDVLFTFKAIKNNNYKSPLRSGFFGVDLEKIDDQNIEFILEEPYAAFLNLLTFGILPENLWFQINPESAGLAELNLKPIGSGPYKFSSLKKDKSGNLKSYHLSLNENYYGDKHYVEKINFKFFPSTEEAINNINNNEIDSINYLPRNMISGLVAKDSLMFHKMNLPQINAIFLNQKNNSALEDIKIREALSLAINKNDIIFNIFSGEARSIDGPILPSNFAYNNDLERIKYNPQEAEKRLDEAEWEKTEITEDDIKKSDIEKNSEDENIAKKALGVLEMGEGSWRIKDGEYLKIHLSTVEAADNIEVVSHIKTDWEKIGIKTITNIIPLSQIQSEIIRPRNFEALLYGQITGNDPDSYAFWHSSQTTENGLNISNYSNKEVDKLLEDARLIFNVDERIEKYKKFQEIIAKEIPAIFLYSPTYTYVQAKKVKGFEIKNIILPHDRFNNINEWYIKTGKKIIW